jgi:hypothetical protein
MKNHTDYQARHSSVISSRHEAIATLAYDLWLRAGRPDNQAQTHWLEAEQALVDAPPEDGLTQPLLPVDF